MAGYRLPSGRVVAVVVDVSPAVRQLGRSMQAAADAMLLHLHATVLDLGREWEWPEFVLDEDDLEAMEARAFARTLGAIDDLPERTRPTEMSGPVTVAERLRHRAQSYELKALVQEERGDAMAAAIFAGVAITLRELADVEEETSDDEGRTHGTAW